MPARYCNCSCRSEEGGMGLGGLVALYLLLNLDLLCEVWWEICRASRE
jgi:hypothetical protein